MTGKEEEGAKFKDYFDWTEPASKAPSHRILAIRRGEKEEVLFSRLTPPEEEALALLERLFVKGKSAAALEVKAAVHDGYKRLLAFQMEGEARLYFKKKADEEAIRVFAENLRGIAAGFAAWAEERAGDRSRVPDGLPKLFAWTGRGSCW